MANRLQLKRGTTTPGSIFYEGEPIYDKSGKVLYVGDNGGTGSGSGSAVASAAAYSAVVQLLTAASSSAGGSVKFYEDTDNGNNYVQLAAPASVASNTTFVLPATDGSEGHILKTDGSGNLSFAAPSASSFTLAADSGTNDTFNTGDRLTFEGGEGIDTVVSDNKITISAELASTTNAGVASFTTEDFSVTGGLVSLQQERIQDIVGAMVSGNTESGISVVYQDADGTLDFDVSDFTITLGGDLSGIATVTNLGNATLTATIAANSVALGSDTTGDYVASITSGGGLTGGATGEGSTPTLAVGAGIGITVNADDVALKNASNLSNNTVLGWDTTGSQLENTPLTYSGNDVSIAGDLTITGNDIKSSGGTTAVTLAGANASVAGDLTVSGNLRVVGTAVTFETQTVKVEDRIIELGLVDGSAPSSSTTWDTGIAFNYFQTSAKKSGLIWLNNEFMAMLSEISESADTGTADPQITATAYAPVAAGGLYVGGIASGNQVINSSQEAVNLIFDGGSY